MKYVAGFFIILAAGCSQILNPLDVRHDDGEEVRAERQGEFLNRALRAGVLQQRVDELQDQIDELVN